MTTRLRTVLWCIFSVICVANIYLWWFGITESAMKKMVVLDLECPIPILQMRYYKASTKDETNPIYIDSISRKWSAVTSGKPIPIVIRSPNAFERRKILERWLVVEIICADDMNRKWVTVADVNDHVIESGKILLQCPCGRGEFAGWTEVKESAQK